MERKSFLRSLLTLAVAPKLMAELNISKVATPLPSGPTTLLFNQLNVVVPDYIPALMAKYGDVDFVTIMNEIANEPPAQPLFWFEDRTLEPGPTTL